MRLQGAEVSKGNEGSQQAVHRDDDVSDEMKYRNTKTNTNTNANTNMNTNMKGVSRQFTAMTMYGMK